MGHATQQLSARFPLRNGASRAETPWTCKRKVQYETKTFKEKGDE